MAEGQRLDSVGPLLPQLLENTIKVVRRKEVSGEIYRFEHSAASEHPFDHCLDILLERDVSPRLLEALREAELFEVGHD